MSAQQQKKEGIAAPGDCEDIGLLLLTGRWELVWHLQDSPGSVWLLPGQLEGIFGSHSLPRARQPRGQTLQG